MATEWILADERAPKADEYVLLSFSNFSLPLVGRYEEDENGGNYYIGDEMETCLQNDIYVNAWLPLPKCYNEDEEEDDTEVSAAEIIKDRQGRGAVPAILEETVNVVCRNFCKYAKTSDERAECNYTRGGARECPLNNLY